MMGCLGLILLVLIALPLVFVLIFFNIITISFAKLGSQFIGIGGAGVFDGIFLAGIVAALIT